VALMKIMAEADAGRMHGRKNWTVEIRCCAVCLLKQSGPRWRQLRRMCLPRQSMAPEKRRESLTDPEIREMCERIPHMARPTPERVVSTITRERASSAAVMKGVIEGCRGCKPGSERSLFKERWCEVNSLLCSTGRRGQERESK